MRTNRSVRSARGFTLVELGACIAIGSLFTGAYLVSQPESGKPAAQPGTDPAVIARAQAVARQVKDATQIRGINQAFIIFANNNQERYPLPSLFDTENHTVKPTGRQKDTTANIMSMLIYNGSFPPEMLVSPAEANANIKHFDKYEYSGPRKSVDPAKALWDPALDADFTDGDGHISYAHLQPSEKRLPKWSNTFSSSEAVVSNRGPKIEGVEAGENGARKPTGEDAMSTTYLIHGERQTWEGNVSYNDCHVDFISSTATPGGESLKNWAHYTDAEGKSVPDVVFFDEADDKKGDNLFLGIFTRAGSQAKDFKPIWD
ncbi:MAG: hypothetical protein H7Y88_04380 [Phycisphaerales bacterium]|nr:hypothetical protein [Phycisphaerales bacterium]